ncbi:MAG: 3'-5' exoribonuclease YhaM family protein [Cellulosilyticaceae bacterium]
MSYISELRADTPVKGNYLCKYKQVLKNKNGKEYYSLKLQDHTGLVDSKIWAIHPGITQFNVDDVVYVEGDVISYQDNLQLNVNKIHPLKPGTYNLKEFLPHTSKDMDVLQKQLMALIDGVAHPYIKQLLEAIFYEDNLYEKFLSHGAAKAVHHAYLGGLLEHTITVAQIGKYMSELYTGVNQDLVVAGCLLHDIGKLYELSAFPSNDYTDEGQLLGHLTMGAEKIHDTARAITDFPYEIELLLKHIVLSHHGEYEFGSPKRPKCIEAMIVHLADNADAKVKMLEEMVQSYQGEESYVGYHKILTRNIRKANL